MRSLIGFTVSLNRQAKLTRGTGALDTLPSLTTQTGSTLKPLWLGPGVERKAADAQGWHVEPLHPITTASDAASHPQSGVRH